MSRKHFLVYNLGVQDIRIRNRTVPDNLPAEFVPIGGRGRDAALVELLTGSPQAGLRQVTVFRK